MNLEQRYRSAHTIGMALDDIQAVRERLSRSLGDQDPRVQKLQQAMVFLLDVKLSLSGRDE